MPNSPPPIQKPAACTATFVTVSAAFPRFFMVGVFF